LLPGAPLVLDLVGFDPSGYDMVVTGEGTVDRTTTLGKAPGEVARRCALAGVRCVVFAGRIGEALPDIEVIPLSGDPAQAEKDLVELGRFLGEAKAE
jgi:glycerate kinase